LKQSANRGRQTLLFDDEGWENDFVQDRLKKLNNETPSFNSETP